MKIAFKSLYRHIIALIVFIIAAVMYFYPQIEGKVLQQSDLIHYKGMAKEVLDFQEKTGETSLWTNSMFSGMPTYQITAPQKKNISRYFLKIFKLGFTKAIGLFILGMVGFYILLSIFGVNSWLSMVGAIGFALSTNNLVLYDAGHITKLQTIFVSAPVIAGVIMTYRGKYILGATVFGLFMSLNLTSNHPQMTYYLAICLVIFVFIQFFDDWKRKNLVGFAKASGILILASFIALGTAASKIITTIEYAQSTMRGKPVLKSDSQSPQSSSETDGLAWDYAMAWSNGKIDLISSFIPGVVGGSSSETVGPKSEFALDLSKRGVNVRKGIKAPLYWGGLPSTSGPVYFGALIFFLFIFSLFLIKNNLKWWIAGSVVLMMLLSLGKNFDWFNRFFFDMVPLYNKFRTPNSVLSIAALFIPFLAFLGIQKVLDGQVEKAKMLKWLYISAGTIGFICLFFATIAPSFFDFTGKNDVQYEQQYGYNIMAIIMDRKALMRSDSIRSLLLIALGALSIWLFLKSKMNSFLLIASLSILILFDFWTIGKRYINRDDFVVERISNQNYTPRQVDIQILEDSDPHFRVLDLSINTYNSSFASYFHNTIGGYHAAKLQRYQDLIEHHISVNNRRVLNMLNTKYFIIPGDKGVPAVQFNSAALGNAWFINQIQMVEDANAEIDALTSFDPNGDVIVHKEYIDYVSGFQPVKNGSIQLTDYKPNELIYRTNTNSEQMAVFSEIWYGPDKGWNAYIDGIKTEYIRVNYALRGLRVPAGQHEIRFKFDPASYRLGETISFISSILLLAGLLFFIWKVIFPFYKGRKKFEEKNMAMVKKRFVKKTKAKKKPGKNKKF